MAITCPHVPAFNQGLISRTSEQGCSSALTVTSSRLLEALTPLSCCCLCGEAASARCPAPMHLVCLLQRLLELSACLRCCAAHSGVRRDGFLL